MITAIAFALEGCSLLRPPPLSPAPQSTPEASRPKPVKPKPAVAAPTPQAASSPTETCRSLALQRASDARSLGRDTKAQRQVQDETYADCMSGKPVQ